MSESNWKRDSAQLGQSGNMAPARSQAASPSRGRAASKSPVRTARSSKASASPAKQPAGLPISPKGRPKGSPSATRQFERQADRQGSHLADGQDHAAGLASSGVMSYGTYGGVSFSSFTPEMPAGSSGKVANEDDGESFAAHQLQQRVGSF